MDIFGLSLVVAAAFCHAGWNLILKRLGGGGPELLWIVATTTVVLYMPAAIWVYVTEAPTLGLEAFILIIGSMLLHLAYFLLLQRGYRTGDLSIIYPTARATGPFLSAFIAILVLGEDPSLQTIIGGFITIAGVLGLTGNARGPQSSTSVSRSSILFGLGTGAFIASYTVLDAYAVATAMISPILLDYGSNVGRCILLFPRARKNWAETMMLWQAHWRALLLVGILSPLAYLLVLFALVFTPVVYVAPTREISVVLSVLGGSILLGEGDLRRRMSWAFVIFAGIAALATG